MKPFPKPELLIFDLDGTLIDSKLDLVLSVNATLRHMGRGELEPERIASYVGNGAPTLMRRALGAETPETELERALEFFVRYYHDHSLDNTTLYEGTRETLDRAREMGLTMAVLTNKPVRISQHILEQLAIGELFYRVYGGNSFPEKKPDPIGIETLIGETGAAKERTLMIGDSAVDIQTARNAGVYAVGMTYGLQPESLVITPPDLLLDRMADLIDYL